VAPVGPPAGTSRKTATAATMVNLTASLPGLRFIG
jgi:hypothetical protein